MMYTYSYSYFTEAVVPYVLVNSEYPHTLVIWFYMGGFIFNLFEEENNSSSYLCIIYMYD